MSGPAQPKTFREPKAPVRMKAKSSKTAARDRRYSAERAVFLSERPWCEVTIEHVCPGRASEVHHKAGRGSGVFFDHDLWLPACHEGHAYLTNHPAEAIEAGLSVRRNGVRP